MLLYACQEGAGKAALYCTVEVQGSFAFCIVCLPDLLEPTMKGGGGGSNGPPCWREGCPPPPPSFIFPYLFLRPWQALAHYYFDENWQCQEAQFVGMRFGGVRIGILRLLRTLNGPTSESQSHQRAASPCCLHWGRHLVQRRNASKD